MPLVVRDLVPAFLDFWSAPDGSWEAYVGQHPEVLNDLVRNGRTLDAERREKALAGYASYEERINANAPLARPWLEDAADMVCDLLDARDLSIDAVAMVGVCTSNGWVDAGTLYLALEMIPDARLGGMLAAHEMAHIVQVGVAQRAWPAEGALGLQVFSEGFATAVTAELYPQFSLAEQLWFEAGHDEWLAACESQRRDAEAAILSDHKSQDDDVIGGYLTLRGNTALPARIGYFVGTMLIQSLAHQYSLREMARWPPERAMHEVVTELARRAA